VLDGEIEFTNLDWQISEGDLLAHFEFEAVKLINDFAAQALACPRLHPEELRAIGPKMRGGADCPLVVLGAGTGFGVAGLARADRGDVAIATEGGHAAFAPTDELEVEVWRRLTARHGRASIERLLSGPGLYELYTAMAAIEGKDAPLTDERAVTVAGNSGDALASAALDRFCDILGSVAGDLALSFGARGGVFISGGIAPRLADRLDAGGFRARFEDKGRLAPYLREIPTSLVLHPYPAIVGAARELEQMERL
jgi:glucokinase